MNFSIEHTNHIPQADILYVSHLLKTEQEYVYKNMGDPHSLVIDADYLCKKLQSSGFLLAKTVTGKIVGILDYTDISADKNGSYIGHNIVIHRNYRGNGIGKTLLQRYIELIKDTSIFQGNVYLNAYIHHENNPSIKLHLMFDYEIRDDVKRGDTATFYGRYHS